MDLLILLFILIGILSGLVAGMGGGTGFIIIATLLFFTELSSSEIAGTTSTMFVIATVFGAILYTFSGDQEWKLVFTIIPSVLIGTQIGVSINQYLPEIQFRLFLGFLATFLGVLLIYDVYSNIESKYKINISTTFGVASISLLGVVVGITSGITGLGGVAILVPSLIILGIPPLVSISTAITQGVVVTSATATRYILDGMVHFEYVILLGIPFALSQIVGWKYAHIIQTKHLKLLLGSFQIVFGSYISIQVFAFDLTVFTIFFS